MLHFLIEDLPGELSRLFQHHATVFRIGVIAEVSPFVDEALTVRIDHDRERIGVFLKLVADREVAEFRRVHFPLHGMAAGPVAARRRADFNRHADAVAGVVAAAAYLREVPARTEIARAPFRIGLKATAGKHYGLRAQLDNDAIMPGADAFDPVAVEQ